MKNKVITVLFAVLFIGISNSFAQGVAINNDGSSADGSAMLDIKATTAGMLIPRMSEMQRDALVSPATSLIIFQTNNTPGYYYNSGTPASPVWERLATGNDLGFVDGSGAATRVAFWTAANTLGSNANLYWDNTNGRLGVGTSSPSQKVHILGTSAGDGGWVDGILIQNSNATTGEAAISFNNNATAANYWTVGVNQMEHYDISYGTSFNNGNTKMRIQSDGKVGIGTVSPTSQLHTTGTVRFQNYPSGANGAIIRSDASGNLATTNFSGSASDLLLGDNTFGTIEDAGGVVSSCGTANYVPKMASSTEIACSQIFDNGTNVGIGTSSPSYKLQTNGDIYANGGWLRVAGSNGLIFQSYGGGFYMTDATWIRTYNNKSFYHNSGIMRTDGTLQVGGSGATLNVPNGGNFSYRTNVLFANTAGNVGIGNSAPSQKLHVTGNARVTGAYYDSNNSPGAADQVLSSTATGTEWTKAQIIQSNSGVVTAGNWYRIASNSGNRADASFTLRDQISGGGHSTMRFHAGVNYGNASGISFSLLSHSIYSTATFTKVRINRNSTYDGAYLEVYCNKSGNVEYDIYDNFQGSGWTPVDWTAGSIPGGWTAHEYETDRLFAIGATDDALSLTRSGNLGIGTTSPIRKLEVYGASGSAPARFGNPNGYVDIGPQNTSWSHFSTDRPRFFFNTGLTVDSGNIGSYDENLSLQTSGTTRITVLNSNGNVGIGMTTPAEKLVVNGWIGRTAHENGGLVGSYNNVGANSANSNPIYTIGSSYKPTSTTLGNMYGIGYTHTNASFVNNTTGSWGMYVAADGDARIWLAASAGGDSYFNAGDVGIGTTSPTEKLHVVGNSLHQETRLISSANE